MSDLFKRIDTVFLEVTDIDRSIKWYTEVLGFNLRWHAIETGYAAIDIGETPLTLVQANEVKPSKQCPFNFYTPDINNAFEALKNNGVEVEEIVDYGDVLTFNFKDPDGHILAVCFFEE